MNLECDVSCPGCSHRQMVNELEAGAACTECHQMLFQFLTDAIKEGAKLDQCPACGSAHLYKQKDFNRKIGIGLLVVGVVLAFFTYGISLILVTILDWLLYRMVGEVGCCYQCGALFRGEMVGDLEAFNLVLHDHYSSRAR